MNKHLVESVPHYQRLTDVWKEYLNTLPHHGDLLSSVRCEGIFFPSEIISSTNLIEDLPKEPTPVAVCFADQGNFPSVPGIDPFATPQEMVLKFLPSQTKMPALIAYSCLGFPLLEPSVLVDYLQALVDDRMHPCEHIALAAFFNQHERARRFLLDLKLPPVSFATQSYYGIHTFQLKGHPSHFQITPVSGEQHLDIEKARTCPANFRFAEISTRLSRSPICFRWWAISDTSKGSLQIDLGVISLQHSTQLDERQAFELNPMEWLYRS